MKWYYILVFIPGFLYAMEAVDRPSYQPIYTRLLNRAIAVQNEPAELSKLFNNMTKKSLTEFRQFLESLDQKNPKIMEMVEKKIEEAHLPAELDLLVARKAISNSPWKDYLLSARILSRLLQNPEMWIITPNTQYQYKTMNDHEILERVANRAEMQNVNAFVKNEASIELSNNVTISAAEINKLIDSVGVGVGRFLINGFESVNFAENNTNYVLIGGRRGEIIIFEWEKNRVILAIRIPEVFQLAGSVYKVYFKNKKLSALLVMMKEDAARKVISELVDVNFKLNPGDIENFFSAKNTNITIDQVEVLNALYEAMRNNEKVMLTPYQQEAFNKLPEWLRIFLNPYVAEKKLKSCPPSRVCKQCPAAAARCPIQPPLDFDPQKILNMPAAQRKAAIDRLTMDQLAVLKQHMINTGQDQSLNDVYRRVSSILKGE